MKRRVLSLSMLMLVAVAGLGAQQPQPGQLRRSPVTAGRSTVLSTAFDVTRIAITNPAIADAVVVRPREVLIDGKSPGTITLMVWGATERLQYDIVVEQPVSSIEQQLHQLFPGEEVAVTVNADGIVLSGRASSTQVMLRIGEIVRAAQPESERHQHAAGARRQRRPAGDAAGADRRSQSAGNERAGNDASSRARPERATGSVAARPVSFPRSSSQELSRTQTPTSTDVSGKMEFSDFLNIFLFNTNWNAGALVRALKQTGHFQSLAEPNLIAYNGREASFLAGGEFPVPIVTGAGPGLDSVQGVRRPPQLHADDCRRSDSAEGPSGSERARLQQRHHAGWVPHSRPADPSRRNGSGAARRSIVRRCRADRQHGASRFGGDSACSVRCQSSDTCSGARPTARSARSCSF